MPENLQLETLTEYVSNAGRTLAVDREHGVIKGVKVLGLTSKNGRTYTEAAVQKALPLYEGARVNIDHSSDPKASRSYRDRIGVLKEARIDQASRGIVADLHFNTKHPLAEQLAWDAENSPASAGLSHNADARVRRNGRGIVVEEITHLRSVDLVADPATTSTLFEHTEPEDMATDTSVTEAKILAERDSFKEQAATLTEEVKTLSEQLQAVTEERDALKAKADEAALLESIEQALTEAKVHEKLATDAQKRLLMLASEDERKSIIESLAETSKTLGSEHGKVQAKDQSLVESNGGGQFDVAKMARQLKASNRFRG